MTQRNDDARINPDDLEVNSSPNPEAPTLPETTPNSYERGIGGEEGTAGGGWHDSSRDVSRDSDRS